MKVRIAVPSNEGMPVFDLHECGEITIVDVDTGRIGGVLTASVDPREPDSFSRQLEGMGVHILIAGGIRPAMLDRLNRSRINLVTGVRGKTVVGLVATFLEGAPPIASHIGGRRPAE